MLFLWTLTIPTFSDWNCTPGCCSVRWFHSLPNQTHSLILPTVCLKYIPIGWYVFVFGDTQGFVLFLNSIPSNDPNTSSKPDEFFWPAEAAKALACMGLEGARKAVQIAQCLEDDYGLAQAALELRPTWVTTDMSKHDNNPMRKEIVRVLLWLNPKHPFFFPSHTNIYSNLICKMKVKAMELVAKDALLKLLSSECFATKEACAAGVALHFKGGQPKVAPGLLVEALLRETRCDERPGRIRRFSDFAYKKNIIL